MLKALTSRREDGTLVGVVNGLPYHILLTDPLWPQAEAMAAEMGDTLPIELPPAPLEPPPAPPAPTKAELMAQLQAIAAQIAALPE